MYRTGTLEPANIQRRKYSQMLAANKCHRMHMQYQGAVQGFQASVSPHMTHTIAVTIVYNLVSNYC